MATPTNVSVLYHQVNLSDAGEQTDPAVVDIGSGRYIVVWTEGTGGPIGTSAGTDLVGQIFNADGSRFGSEFQVNASFFDDFERDAALESRIGGGFVMVYEDSDASGVAIRVQTRDVNGALVGGTPLTIQSDTNADILSNPAVAMRNDGSYLVAYNRSVAADGFVDVVGRIVSAAGVVGNEFNIFDSSDNASNPDIDVLGNSNYVVVYQDADDATLADFDPQFRVVNSTGGIEASGTIDSGANLQFDVQVAAIGGGFVAVWVEENGDGSGTGIRARIYDNDGVAQGAAFTVNVNYVGNDQDSPDVAALDGGGFFVTWRNDDFSNINTRRFDANGNPVGSFGFGVGDEGEDPAITRLSDGRIVVAIEQTLGDNDIGAMVFAIEKKTNDFNDDLRSDILWRNDNGTVATWDMNGAEVLGTHSFAGAPSDWHLQGTGDFNGDGRSDLLWRQDIGTVGIWHMDGATIWSMPTYEAAPPEWHIEGTGDFNGDNISDILWRHNDGTVGTWHMKGDETALSDQSFGAQPLDWHIEGTGDFNGDGMADILWRHDNGDIGTWHMNGAAVLSTQVFANSPNEWHIEGTGDFNGDGKSDLLWRHDDGTVGTWHMDGATVLSTQTFGNAPNSWHIQGTGDYNADGEDDILWRADDGTVGVWNMRGAIVISTPTYAPQPSDWHIIGNGFDMI